MLKQYSENATLPGRSQQLWIMLTCLAENRKSSKYGLIAARLRWKGSGTMGQFLAPILYFCLENNLPPLTVLVVNDDTGLPGFGFGDIDPNKARERVFDFPWHDYQPPSEVQLKEAYDRGCISNPQFSGR